MKRPSLPLLFSLSQSSGNNTIFFLKDAASFIFLCARARSLWTI